MQGSSAQEIAINTGQKVICMAVDGLVKKEQSEEGVILKDKRGCLTNILLSVDRNSIDITYYEPKFDVVYSGHLFVTQIILLLQRHLHRGHIWSDSDSYL